VDQYAAAIEQVSHEVMDDTKTPHRSVATLFRLAVVMQAGARRLRAAAKWLDARLERRRITTAALHDFGTMSERELLDIGLIRVDMRGVTSGALFEIRNRT
jgi:hypothetical protein